MSLNRLQLEQKHVELGARMVPFGGWNMPVQYAPGIIKEHEHTRSKVSLFDISHMGEFRVTGEGAAACLNKLLARPVETQKVGICRYNFLMNDKGGVRDDLILYRMADEDFFVVVNAACAADDAAYIKANLPETVTFVDVSDDTGKLDLQGPLAFEVMKDLGFDLDKLPGYFKFIEDEIAGVPCIISRTGYTGERGVEFYVKAEYLEKLWDALMAHDAVEPCGLGARDTLRLEVGYALYGHELNDETTPLEIGYGHPLVKVERDFVGAEALRANPQSRFLTGIELEGKRAAREGAVVYNTNEEVIGKITSGSFGPSVGKAVALSFINEKLEDGTEVLMGKAPKYLKGVVSSVPFYKEGTVRD